MEVAKTASEVVDVVQAKEVAEAEDEGEGEATAPREAHTFCGGLELPARIDLISGMPEPCGKRAQGCQREARTRVSAGRRAHKGDWRLFRLSPPLPARPPG